MHAAAFALLLVATSSTYSAQRSCSFLSLTQNTHQKRNQQNCRHRLTQHMRPQQQVAFNSMYLHLLSFHCATDLSKRVWNRRFHFNLDCIVEFRRFVPHFFWISRDRKVLRLRTIFEIIFFDFWGKKKFFFSLLLHIHGEDSSYVYEQKL